MRLVSTSEPLHHPRFVQLATCFARAGNIFFVYPQRTGGCLFFPSGYIFLLRQPVVESNYSAWQKLKNGLNHDETKFRFKLHAEILGAAFRVMIDGTIQKKSVVIAQLGCLPHNLARAVEYCQRIGILSEEREFRMTICDVSQIPHSLNCYEGDRAKGVLSFSLYEFGTRSHQILEQEADSKFFSIWRTDRHH